MIKMESNSIFDKIGGRKFVMAIVVIIVAALIDALGKNGLSTNMIAILGTVYATFSASNAFVTSKAQQLAAPTGEEPQQVPPPPPPAQPEAPVQPQGPTVQDIMPGLTNALNTVGSEIQSMKDQHVQTTQQLNTLQKAVVKLMQQQGPQ